MHQPVKQLRGQNCSRTHSEGALPPRASQGSAYSLLTGKRLKSSAEVLEDIKVKRVKSYQKISFSIRKMDCLFKSEFKEQ
jgi:hypothetical protein